MDIRLRREAPGDEEAIDLVNCRAFESMDEANIVRLMRMHHPGFDRRYSITAWEGETLVGHALFTPARIRLLGETVSALALGPIAVLPERQKRGIGGELLRFGHDLGKRDGFSLAFLNGHPSYYSRYGYKSCFGFVRVKVDREKLPQASRKFQLFPVREEDIPWLVERHAVEWADVDFGWLWGSNRNEWAFPPMNTVMWWTEDGRRAAYAMDTPGKGKCRLLLGDDPDLMRDVIATIRPETLEHHPSGWLAKNVLDPDWAEAKVKAGAPAMAFELQESILAPCMKAQETGERLPGFTMFPLPFLAC